MAETFLAVRRGPGGFEQHVCLKRILPAFEENAEFVRLFLEEARVSARLRHTNIVQVLDFGVVEGSHFLALELVEGLDMRIVLEQLRGNDEAMTSGLVSYLAFELGAALDFAHEAGPDGSVKGVVHRDISPSNVLLSRAGEVKLTDFGIAKAMNTTHITRSGNIKGKVPYMAPEYAMKMQYDARSDLFALGVTLYEALVGRRPFDGLTELDTMRRIQDGEHVPLPEAAPGVPAALSSAIERLLLPNPDDRFANAADFLDALVDVAPPPTSRRILGELVRRCMARRQEETEQRKAQQAAWFESPGGVADAVAREGTEALNAEPAPLPGAVKIASPSAETRTREPTGVAAPREGFTHDIGTAQTLAVATPGSVKSPGPRAGAQTKPLDGAPPRHGVAVAPTKPVADAPHDTVQSPPNEFAQDRTPLPASIAPARRGPPAWAWAALAVATVGVAAAGIGIGMAGSSDEPPEVQAASPATEPATATGVEHGAVERVTAQGEDTTEPATEALPVAQPATNEPEATEEPPPSEANDAPARPRSQSQRETRARAAEATAREPAERRTRSARASEAPATLSVIVIPFGDVWVDGRHVGTAPLDVEVPAGRHVVAAGEGSPTKRTTVQVTPGQRRRVVLR